jgi:hypothetical protein
MDDKKLIDSMYGMISEIGEAVRCIEDDKRNPALMAVTSGIVSSDTNDCVKIRTLAAFFGFGYDCGGENEND